MSQPILSIRANDAKSTTTANLLPCHIHHDGPIDPVASFWNPAQDEDGIHKAYFRGRKLHGKTVSLPANHRGVILQQTPPSSKQQRTEPAGMEDNVVDLDGEEDQGPEVGEMKVQGEFEEMIVWGHERVEDGKEDIYMRGVEEWLVLAGKIHGYEDQDQRT